MADYLLDTHTAIWYFNGDDRLSQAAKDLLADPACRKSLSVASAWELAIKIGIGKLRFAGHSAGFIHLAEINDIAILPIKTSHLTALEGLPIMHRDPFDRLLVATALAEQMTLITVDENIVRYNVSHIW